eukprot:6202577-Pleurochrysis_carterae.AAC.5
MSKHVGIPIKVLHDAEGHTVTVELKNGEVYRGKLDEAEDNMNVHLSNVTKTMKDGRVNVLSKGRHTTAVSCMDSEYCGIAMAFLELPTERNRPYRGGKCNMHVGVIQEA